METTAAPLPATSTALLDSPRMAPPSASVDRGTRIPPERRQSLRELWLDVEPFLTSEERAMLGSGTFDVLFPVSPR